MLKKIVKFVACILLIQILVSCAVVNPGEVAIKTTLGNLKKNPLEPGTHLWIPTIDSLFYYSTRTVALPEEFATLTKDGQGIKITGIAQYSLNADKVSDIYANLGTSGEDVKNKVIVPILLNAVKVQIAERNLTSVYEDQNGLSTAISKDIEEQLAQNQYVKFSTFKVTGIVLDSSVQEAIERKQIAKQDLERKNTEIEIAKKESERLTILKQAISPLTIQQDFVNKWDGKTPIGSDILITTQSN